MHRVDHYLHYCYWREVRIRVSKRCKPTHLSERHVGKNHFENRGGTVGRRGRKGGRARVEAVYRRSMIHQGGVLEAIELDSNVGEILRK